MDIERLSERGMFEWPFKIGGMTAGYNRFEIPVCPSCMKQDEYPRTRNRKPAKERSFAGFLFRRA
jgi:hypothetical protein